MEKIPHTIGNYILPCGFDIVYRISQKYRPIWVLVLVLDQNSGFGCTLHSSYLKVSCIPSQSRICDKYHVTLFVLDNETWELDTQFFLICSCRLQHHNYLLQLAFWLIGTFNEKFKKYISKIVLIFHCFSINWSQLLGHHSLIFKSCSSIITLTSFSHSVGKNKIPILLHKQDADLEGTH